VLCAFRLPQLFRWVQVNPGGGISNEGFCKELIPVAAKLV
jgi:hypothetical protein